MSNVENAVIECELRPLKQPPVAQHAGETSNSEEQNTDTSLDAVQFTSDDRCSRLQRYIKRTAYILLVLGFLAYLTAALIINLRRALPLLIATVVVLLLIIYFNTTQYWQPVFYAKVIEPLVNGVKSAPIVQQHGCLVSIGLATAVTTVLAVVLLVGLRVHWSQFQSLLGISAVISILYITSKDRKQVKWRPVIMGLLLQFVLGLLIIRTEGGVVALDWIGKCVVGFLNYSNQGAELVFGSIYRDNPYALFFLICPVIVFASSVISVLYYLGAMQFVIQKIGWIMESTMGTTGPESLSCAANIFFGQTEAPLLIRPLLPHLSQSELHAVMTGGFSTIAGGVLASFASMGIPANELIAASVMNAPVALALSKLSCPETEPPSRLRKLKTILSDDEDENKPRNVLDAAARGASMSIGLCANIMAMLISFVSILKFADASLGWLGSMVDYPDASLELLFSLVFMPVAFLIGVPWKESRMIGQLLGTKYLVNEFVAYQKLNVWLQNKATCTAPFLSSRVSTIATFALCSFANPGSIGIQLAGLGAMAPQRQRDLAQLVIRAVLVGACVTVVTASTASILSPMSLATDPACITELLNSTEIYNFTSA